MEMATVSVDTTTFKQNKKRIKRKKPISDEFLLTVSLWSYYSEVFGVMVFIYASFCLLFGVALWDQPLFIIYTCSSLFMFNGNERPNDSRAKFDAP